MSVDHERWWARILRSARPSVPGFAALLALTLAGVAFEALKPWPIKLIVDNALIDRPLPDPVALLHRVPGGDSAIGLVLILAFASVLLLGLLQVIWIATSYLKVSLGRRMDFHLAHTIFNHVQYLSLSYHTLRRTGDLVTRITRDTRCASELLHGVLLPLITALLTLGLMFRIMWSLDPRLALIAIFFALPLGVITRMFFRPMSSAREHELQIEGELTDHAERTLTALPLVQSLGVADSQTTTFRDLGHRLTSARLGLVRIETRFKLSSDAIVGLGTGTVMALGGWQVIQGEMTVGSLLVFLSYVTSLYAPAETLAFLSQSLAYSSAGAGRVLEVLDSEDRLRERGGTVPLSRREAQGDVRFDGVTFGYLSGRPVLEDITFTAGSSQRIAIVGRTGSGKTTLMSLLPRFYDPWSGMIRIGDRDIREYELESLRSRIAMVPQEPILLPTTIARNIAYARPEASPQEIERAAFLAQAHEFINDLPEGYDTVIGDGGSNLSVGQRQRIAIARAVLKDAPILVLDEPTSALDVQTEQDLIRALNTLMRGRLTFIIAHRLSTVRSADRILVLEAGRIIEDGDHDSLISRHGTYRELWTAGLMTDESTDESARHSGFGSTEARQ